MSFAENLQKVRRENHLSQEELAEILDVSRQAVSKWEQGTTYPEVEKLLLLANKLNVSLDSLMSTEITREQAAAPGNVTGSITISSPHEHVVATCYKVLSSQRFLGGEKAPRYALFGATCTSSSFWGSESTFLGWYATEELLRREMDEIRDALFSGISTYELKYSAKVTRHFLSIKIEE